MKWSLLRRIETYLKRTRTRPTTFGREAVRDPQLVFQLRDGRVPRPPMEKRILAYLDRVDPASNRRRGHRRRP